MNDFSVNHVFQLTILLNTELKLTVLKLMNRVQGEGSPVCIIVLKTLVVHFESQDSCIVVESKIIIGTFNSFDFVRSELWESIK